MESLSRTTYTTILVTLSSCALLSCNVDKVKIAMQKAGDHRSSLDSVLDYYSSEDPRYGMAQFLIANMYDKYCYDDPVLDAYAAYFDSLLIFRERYGLIKETDSVVKRCWDSIVAQNGPIRLNQLGHKLDCRELSADFLIDNINQAYAQRDSIPAIFDTTLQTFLEYVLPYRIANEKAEPFRKTYLDRFRNVRDTTYSPKLFLKEFLKIYRQTYTTSNILKKYPVDMSLSQVEKAHGGACRHNVIFYALQMRALGIPVTVDFARAWANRSQGHAWNVLFLNDGGRYPFDAFRSDTICFAYKPAKIFRHIFSAPVIKDGETLNREVPREFWASDAIDVTDEYGHTYDIEIPCFNSKKSKTPSYATICVFDNKRWIPIWYGPHKRGKASFSKMHGDVAYLAGWYSSGDITPASLPFILTKEGDVKQLLCDTIHKQDLVLRRKYPRFKRMDDFAKEMMGAVVEASETGDFRHPDTLFTQDFLPIDMCDVRPTYTNKSYRFFRWKAKDSSTAELAEIVFWGITTTDSTVHALSGTIIGSAGGKDEPGNSYIAAMDGNPATWFSKEKGSSGWVGIDLGKGQKAHLTGLRYCPRSDTNFILQGDRYELLYWQDSDWETAGIQTAAEDSLVYHAVPSGTLYLLKNLTKGKEQRIFTYENNEQIWW